MGRRTILIAGVVLAAAVAGVILTRGPSHHAAVTTTSTASANVDGGDPAAGKALFLSAGCSACHTLTAAGATGTVGPNLDLYNPPLTLIVDRITHGSGVMPSFKGKLSAKQIKDVAAFVYSTQP